MPDREIKNPSAFETQPAAPKAELPASQAMNLDPGEVSPERQAQLQYYAEIKNAALRTGGFETYEKISQRISELITKYQAAGGREFLRQFPLYNELIGSSYRKGQVDYSLWDLPDGELVELFNTLRDDNIIQKDIDRPESIEE
jgi:hypothetical protein